MGGGAKGGLAGERGTASGVHGAHLEQPRCLFPCQDHGLDTLDIYIVSVIREFALVWCFMQRNIPHRTVRNTLWIRLLVISALRALFS